MSFTYRMKPLAAALCALALGGCAAFSGDGGVGDVSAITKARTGQEVRRMQPGSSSAAIDELLARPLDADSAVRIALVNNRGLQASLAQLGVAEADFVQAGRLRNPGFSFARLRGGGDIEIDRGILFDLGGLLTLPIRKRVERGRFEQAKLQAASDALRLAADTRRAYFNAVAAQQTAQYMEQVKEAAEAGAELTQRMAQAGNWSKLDQAREQAFYADAIAQVVRARHNATATREQLIRLLGLSGEKTAFQLPQRLPDLPDAPEDPGNAEAQAMRQRLDLLMAQRDAEATAGALGLTRSTGFISVFHAGYANKSETGKPRANGYEIELELPLFDFGGAKTAKAEALYMQSVHRAADIAVRVRSQVREAHSAYCTSYELAQQYRDEVVPLRKKISDEMLLRYNGMLIGVFELLADARAQIASVNAAIEAQRDFWLADTDLQIAINGDGGAAMQLRGGGSPASDNSEY